MGLCRVSIVSLLLLTLAAPVRADVAPDADETSEQKICINSNRVRNFDGLSDQHVFIEEGGGNYYLLTMRGRCSGLRNAQVILIKETMSRVCSRGFGEVIYKDFGMGRRSCRIDTIERVENKDEARAMIAEREEHAQREKVDKQDD